MLHKFVNLTELNLCDNKITEIKGLDTLVNLKKSKVWLLSANNDTVVNSVVVKKNIELYEKYINTVPV